MRYHITHSTKYTYAEPVSLSQNIVRLRPRDNGKLQSCLKHKLKIGPLPAARSEGLDYFGNHTDYFSLQISHRQLTICAESEVEVTPAAKFDLSQSPAWEEVRDSILRPATPEALLAREYTFDSPYLARSPELAAYALPSFASNRPFLECVLDLTERIRHGFEFLPGSTRVGTPVLDVLKNRRGVCQDFAHLQIGCLRSLGLAGRYVSGYIATTPPAGQTRLVGADVSHAWLSTFDPRLGWIDFDPTNGVMPTSSHITIAWARDYDDIGPIRGILVGGRRQRLHVSVDVVPMSSTS